MKRVILIVSAVVASLGIALPAANAAADHHRAMAPTLGSSIPAVPSVTCGAGFIIENVGNQAYSWNSPSSPYLLYFRNNVGATSYCLEGSGHDIQFFQNGTSRCLYVDTSNRTVIEGSCSSANAQWDIINITSGPYSGYTLLQNNDNKDCLYENGIGFSATYNPCNSGNASDVFY